jgi:hypothetical protein
VGRAQREGPKVREKFNLKEITTMKTRNLFMNILGIFIALILAGTVAPAATITVLETFDFPGATTVATQPQKINDAGLIVGIVVDSAGVTKGFLRGRSGNFSQAFSEPNDTGNYTAGRGINNARVVNGEYLDGTTGTFHGYRLFQGIFTEYNVPNSSSTIPLGINNLGNFCGSLVSTDGSQPAFLNVAGNVTRFTVPDATATLAYSINSTNQVVGYYIDAAGVLHGYLRASDGTLTFPVDAVGSTQTILFANNDANWGVGRYVDSSGVTHGLFFQTPDDIRTFDFPGAAGFTSLNGVNQDGYVSGRYLDSAGIAHGFLGKIVSGAAQPEQSKPPVTPVKPAYPVRLGAPAM